METKVCKRCQIAKPLNEFRERYPGAHSALCRPCLSLQTREYFLAHKEEILANPKFKAYQKEYGAKRANTPEYREKARERYHKNREKILAYAKVYRQTHKAKPRPPHKAKCKDLFRYAVKTGRIQKQPCSVCGALKAEGHHSDYSKPLEVIWLCRLHHRKIHRIDQP